VQLAGCIIKDASGKVLLMHRDTPKRTQWEIPGGGVDPGETPEQTAVRELKEELDVGVKLVRKIGSKEFEEDGESHEYHWFEAEIIENEPRLAEPDMYDDLRYFKIDELQPMFDNLSANTKNFVTALRDKTISL
jgi:8-oxo-dGTP diphosphatase